MNPLRIIFSIGVAVTAYLMILAWQEDYHSNKSTVPTTLTSSTEIGSLANDPADMPTEILASEKQQLMADLPQVNNTQEIVHEVLSDRGDESRYIEVVTDTLNVTIDLVGGDIVDTDLLQYPVTIDNPDVVIDILNNREGTRYVAQSGIIGSAKKDFNANSGRPLFNSDKSSYELKGDTLEVILHHITVDNLEVKKIYRFTKGDYLIQLSYELINRGDTSWVGVPFSQLKRQDFRDPSSQGGPAFSAQNSLAVAHWSPENKFNKVKFSEVKEYREEKRRHYLDESMMSGWIGVIQHYFLAAWVPAENKTHRYSIKYLPDSNQYIVGSTSPSVVVEPGSQVELDSASLYVGPKKQKRLKEISDGLDLSVDYGFLFFISNILFVVLNFIYDIVGNWGWAIVLLTICVKALFYVPSAISYRSMANIKRIQPELLRLREQCGDDKQKLSQEMMKLYQKEKVNPLSGCLPILLQMPVFFALYWMLLESIELRHAEFIFWITDLSSMDQYFVLPLLMGASMFLQTSLNPTPPDPMQAKVMKFMPIAFTVLFLFFPSGLVLYWLTNNILSIAQQWWITKGLEKEGVSSLRKS